MLIGIKLILVECRKHTNPIDHQTKKVSPIQMLFNDDSELIKLIDELGTKYNIDYLDSFKAITQNL